MRAVIERAGGRVEDFWFAFDEYDTVEIIDLPDKCRRGRILYGRPEMR